MKVLMINSVCGIRSTGRICSDIAELLKKNGHECKIAYGREIVPRKYQKDAIRIGNKFSVKLDALKTRLLDNAGFNSKRATKKFIEWIKEYNPDVIHLHNLHGYYINIDILFSYLKTCGKKVVWTLHDCWPLTGHCAYFDSVHCEQWKNGCERCTRKGEYPKSILLNRAKRNYQKKKGLFADIPNMVIVTPSQWLADLVKKSLLKRSEVRVIPNGVSLEHFQVTESDLREKYGLQEKTILLGVASTWAKHKGFHDFIALAGMLESNYQIVLIGVTKKQITELPPQIIAIERTNNVKELAQWYSTADVFINPTYEDNYPTVNLEAQACGIPVVTYATGGSVESVPKCNIVEKGNLEEMRRMLYDRAYSTKISQDVVLNKDACYHRYLELYEE